MNNKEYFDEKIAPVMDEVRAMIQDKQKEEIRKTLGSFRTTLQSASVTPAVSSFVAMDALKYTGEWNSKTLEDYCEMVDVELEKRKVKLNPELYGMMHERLISYEMPKDSTEYIMKRIQNDSIINLPDQVLKSPLQRSVDMEVEKRYNPSRKEKFAARAATEAADFFTLGGGLASGNILAKGTMFAVADVTIDKLADKVLEKDTPNHEGVSLQESAPAATQQDISNPEILRSETSILPESVPQPSVWQKMMEKLSLDKFPDLKENPGYVAAKLPDFLSGLLKDKTPAQMQGSAMISLALILAGLLCRRSPLLKLMLLGIGGASLMSTAANTMKETDKVLKSGNISEKRFRIYADEPLNARITEPVITGTRLIATIDRVPCTVNLTPDILEAYRQGALPLNKLANTILERSDAAREMASRTYVSQTREDVPKIRIQ